MPAVRAHFRALSKRSYKSSDVATVGRDWVALGVLYGGPLLVAAFGYHAKWAVTNLDQLLGGVALLVGGLMAAFGQVASWRAKLTEMQKAKPVSGASQRDHLDEATAHLLMAIYASIAFVVVASVAGNYLPKEPVVTVSSLVSGWTAVLVVIGGFICGLMVMVLSSLWTAYAESNEVPERMGGRH